MGRRKDSHVNLLARMSSGVYNATEEMNLTVVFEEYWGR
jgi:hypothetical protein